MPSHANESNSHNGLTLTLSSRRFDNSALDPDRGCVRTIRLLPLWEDGSCLLVKGSSFAKHHLQISSSLSFAFQHFFEW